MTSRNSKLSAPGTNPPTLLQVHTATTALLAKAADDAVSSRICLLDGAGRILAVNAAWDAFHRPEAAQSGHCGVGADYLRQCDAGDAAARELAAGIRALSAGQGDSFHLEYARAADNFVVAATRFGGAGGDIVVSHENIGARKQVELRLQLAAIVFTHAREGILITDADGTIVDVNDTFTQITGYSRAEAIGGNPRMLKSGRQPPEFYTAMWQALGSGGQWFGEAWNRRKDGEVYAEMITISAVRDAAGKTQNYVALFTDITHMKQYLQQIERITHYDVLTDLPNRVLLADRLRQDIAHCQRRKQSLAVVYIDLDGFKAVNDYHGHDIGDELLIAAARRFKGALREGDTLARIGGDEFVAVLVDLDRAEDCEPVLARLLLAAADPVRIGPLALQVSASMGVTLYPQDGVDADLLLRHADQAMYLAKQAGKNRYHLFDIGRDTTARRHREDLAQIRRALDQEEFVLYYQPKVNMKSGAVIGAEALIRWQHPVLG
ncbi:MAG TPA: GGDEF domain-containing protein, partial [Janthinobacterium sp.]|nr:GGDEF domain-containing protein [Janthinobacterium sp.]